jgi:hypothetical protein
MTRYCALIVCLIATLSTGAALAQDKATRTDDLLDVTSTAAVAYVYVSLENGIDAFAAAADGKLSRVSGSPFKGNVGSMAVNGKYLFGSNGIDIYSFSIASDGALKQVAQINAQKLNGYAEGGPDQLFLDHTGATLYDLDLYGNIAANNTYQSFDVEKSTGALKYISNTVLGPDVLGAPTFIGDNIYAYYDTTYHWAQEIFGFRRDTDGTLVELSIGTPLPEPKPGTGDVYTLAQTVADPTNHMAMAVQDVSGEPYGSNVGPSQLATYTANATGTLSTASTYANMPTTEVENIYDMNMSPSGKLLAVGGELGLQVFHFNGANPITKYTGLIAKDQVVQLFWDNENHLYAFCEPANKLFVFTVTPTSVTEAPGSPYSIAGAPQAIIVLPK